MPLNGVVISLADTEDKLGAARMTEKLLMAGITKNSLRLILGVVPLQTDYSQVRIID